MPLRNGFDKFLQYVMAPDCRLDYGASVGKNEHILFSCCSSLSLSVFMGGHTCHGSFYCSTCSTCRIHSKPQALEQPHEEWHKSAIVCVHVHVPYTDAVHDGLDIGIFRLDCARFCIYVVVVDTVLFSQACRIPWRMGSTLCSTRFALFSSSSSPTAV